MSGRPLLTRSAPLPRSRSGQLDRAVYTTLPGVPWAVGAGRPGMAGRPRAPVPPRRGLQGGTFGFVVACARIECPAVREQCTGIIEHDDAVTEQAPPLLRMTYQDVGGHAIRRQCVRAPGPMFAHDDPPLVWLHNADDRA
jgi:hypothetical protein